MAGATSGRPSRPLNMTPSFTIFQPAISACSSGSLPAWTRRRRRDQQLIQPQQQLQIQPQQQQIQQFQLQNFGCIQKISTCRLKKHKKKQCRTPRRILLDSLVILMIVTSTMPVILQARTTLNAGNPDAKRLYDDLLSNYNKLVRPVPNTTDPLTVRIKLKLSQLIDVVRTNSLFS